MCLSSSLCTTHYAAHVDSANAAIAEYLEETRPEHPLLPTDALQRARVREIVCAIADGIQPLGNLKVLKQVAALVGGDADAHSATMGAWSRSVMNDGFRGLEALLKRSAGAHAVGNEITLADVFIVPQVFNAARWKVDMSPFPTITRIADAAMQLPAFKAAAPAAQPDAE